MPQRLLKDGLSQLASDALRSIGLTEGRVGQTIGGASASAGTHFADGEINGKPYTAAVDLRIKDLSEPELRQLLDRLGSVGFAAWYRPPNWDGVGGSPHVHAVYAGVPMKPALRAQVEDYLEGKDGLKRHRPYAFHPPNAASLKAVRALFLHHQMPQIEEEEMTKTVVFVNGVKAEGRLDEAAGINMVPFTALKPFLVKHGVTFDWDPDAKPPVLKITLPK